ncbi:hypothetical protein OAT84_03440 [Gammaproteobacteria bacterium]|nr:hypothetical protein [Gammaproteobacteria bacterium]
MLSDIENYEKNVHVFLRLVFPVFGRGVWYVPQILKVINRLDIGASRDKKEFFQRYFPEAADSSFDELARALKENIFSPNVSMFERMQLPHHASIGRKVALRRLLVGTIHCTDEEVIAKIFKDRNIFINDRYPYQLI